MYPKLVTIGSFSLPTYGVLVALGFLAGLFIVTRLGRRAGLDPEKVTNLAIYCALSGVAGAKLFMFLFDWHFYAQHPGEILSFATLQAAGVFHGGFLLAVLVALFYMRRHAMPPLLTMDTFAPGVALGHAIGRIGCFAAGCCWGKQCDLPWAVRFHSQEASNVPVDVPLHPAQLYESAANFLLFAFLYWRSGKPHARGTIISLYLILYSAARFGIEFFRNHEQELVGPFSLTQWIALGVLAAGAGLFAFTRRSRPTAAETVPLGRPSPTLSPGR